MTGIDLKDFDKYLVVVEKEIETTTINRMQKLALGVDSALVLATPVDTGRARANWLPSLNIPREEKLLETFDPSGTNSIAEAASVVADVKIGDTIYISNNLEYIGALNDGHSRQAPSGFIEKAVQAVEVL